jgi:hypothetical protein
MHNKKPEQINTTMKKGIIISTAAVLLAAGTVVSADNISDDQSMKYDQNADQKYQGNELSLDAFGTAAIGQNDINHISGNRINHDARLGAGLGLNYFFIRYIGIGGDAYTEDTRHNFVDNASGNLIARLPLGNSGLAPYIYGGAGHKFDPINLSFAQAGGGIEFRFTHNVGLFVDARYVFADKIQNYGVGRTGVRISF